MPPLPTPKNGRSNDDDDEAQVLASVAATLQEQDAYVDQVIRQATHSLAPLLMSAADETQDGDDAAAANSNPNNLVPAGFPSLHALAPSYDARRSQQQQQGNPCDLPHIYSLLTRVRRQQQESAAATNNSVDDDMLYLQEQMLLVFLTQTMGRHWPDLPVPEAEAQHEHERSLALQQQQQRAFARPAADRMQQQQQQPHRRVSMMQRRKQQQQTAATVNQEDNEEKEDDQQRKEELRQLRLERKRRQQERRRQLSQWSTEEEKEDDAASGNTSDEEEQQATGTPQDGDLDNSTTAPNSTDASSTTVQEQQRQDDQAPTDTTTCVTCPLCLEQLVIPDASQTDALFAQHMDSCQNRRSSRRRPAATTGPPPAAAATDQTRTRKRKRTGTRRCAAETKQTSKQSNSSIPNVHSNSRDDLHEARYQDRVDDWIEHGLERMKVMKERDELEELPGAATLGNGVYIPAWMNNRLFGYQRQGLEWMWDLHQQQAGGVVGDEMGLGKTVQVCSFLGVLAASRKLRSVLVVAPATMLQHWLNELEVWAPGLRRIMIHPSGETDGVSRNISSALLRALAKWLQKSRNDRVNEVIDDEDWETMPHHSFCGTGYVVVTTYENLRRNVDTYIRHEWSYVVLDEAQKIRNPDADITLVCKKIRTPHRLAMSGTPIQNDLRELWSLFDFVFPGRLGTLPAFEQEFADPIKRGGYSNATPMQVQLAYRCALTLRDLINPFMLRRQKKEVKETSRMPSKTEHVLFCRLTLRQRSMYEAYIRSKEVASVLRGSKQLFAAITILRKICNHPDLVCDPDETSFQSFLQNGPSQDAPLNENDDSSSEFDDNLGSEKSLVERCGKLEVLSKILPLWHKQGHRVLIFCQWKKMLNIIQRFMMLKEWKFGRLDGNTNVGARQRLVDEFNADDSYFCLLCTTRTGGVGLNLTGANRIVLYDPDWNPSTDAQARERAWRFGQEKEVTIYRLITAGTVEEKIYHRQIFKTALSNKVLQDPRQRRLFSQRDLHDLFSLTADGGSVRAGGDGLTDTGKVTKGVGVVVFEQDVGGADDNERTLRKVMKSKGLAGVFDHHYLEEDVSRKSATAREMEDQAKRVATEAAKALQQSLSSHDPFTPTWTGSRETAPQRFGNNSEGNTHAAIRGPMVRPGGFSNRTGDDASSQGILASLRQKNQAVKSGGQERPPSEEAQQYADLLAQVKRFVQRRAPSTDDILKEFDSVPNCDVAIFRRLLKSVATVDGGKWYLKC